MSARPAPVAAPSALSRYWPAMLVTVALFPPLFISPVAYAEVSVTVIVVGLLAATAIRYVRTGSLRLPRAIALAIGALVALLAVRSLFVDVPMIAFGGAWSSDGTVWAATAIALALLGPSLWLTHASRTTFDRPAITLLFAVIALLATASSVAAWQWGSTDPSGGPASGFTANSQLQLQLLTSGLTAAIAWGVLRRRELAHVLAAAMCGAAIFVGMLECRSSVMLPALALGGSYALALGALRAKVRPGLLATATTTVFGAAQALVAALLLAPATAARVAALFDSLGNGRGTLWTVALKAIAQSPLLGHGPGHSASLSSWTIDGPMVSFVSTADPHSLTLTLAAAGGLLAIAVLLVALFAVQRAWVRAMRVAPAQDLPVLLAIVAGSVMLFALGQFTFVYTHAWVLMALQTGLVLARSNDDLVAVPHTTTARALTVATVGAALVLVLLVWIALPGRSGSTTMLMTSLSAPPATVLERQAALIEHAWNLLPAEIASVYITAWSQGEAEGVERLRSLYDGRMEVVAEPARADARLIASRLRVWSTDASQQRADLAELDRIIADGINASPGLGIWAAAGATFHAHYGAETDARRYAALLLDDPGWWRQAQTSCDPETLALIERLAE